MDEFDGFDMEVRMAERDDDEENPWTDEDQAAYIAHIEDPLVYADIERREAEFLAWARTQNWATTSEATIINRIASTVSQLSQVVGAPSRAANPAHHTQVGGSEDSESADSDSHVLAYHQHLKSLAIWTSALEVISAIIPAAKSIKKQHTYQIGNLRLDLVDYPADFTPDYAAPTLLLAAKLSGFADDEHALFGLLDSLDHPLGQIYTRFQRPLPTTVVHPVVVDDVSNDPPVDLSISATQDHAEIDLAQIARKLDRDGGLHRLVVRVSKRVCGVWAADKTFGDDILHDVTTATYCSLLQKCRSDASTAQVAAYSSEWARSHLRDVLRRLKITVPKGQVQKRLSLAEAVLARHDTTAPMDGAVSAAWDAHRTKLQADVDKYKTTIGGSMVVGVDSLVALLSDAESSISEVDTLMGDTGDMVDSLESAAVIADVRNLFTGPVISDLLEKLSIVSKSTMGCEDHPLEFLAGVISQNKKALAIIKNSIGPDGLAQLARHI
ncbi:hypothetical protein HF289_00430 [Acidithiobacillus ferrooxidans]|uniref:hypothetical protein n=1 Tax=Acidithiobacillus ferrooxidans TaxID=920 RepID=UPI001C07D9B4|nr:hypothetical protein [Acidithiobacillus ferrooxidans]MBU2855394.1 hypothetical protein [Acidithiobacillus ferrooxidans]